MPSSYSNEIEERRRKIRRKLSIKTRKRISIINLLNEGDFVMIKIHPNRKAGDSLLKYEGLATIIKILGVK